MDYCKLDTLPAGFSVKRVREEKELGGRMVELVYDKTGTEICWIDNGCTNKLFSIAFKTLPENSTGVFHILEHSVLCGSEKYPVREPFVELMKSSMNTFLNALTYQDKTMYPISSRNDQDFLNLMGVYLDAVLFPAILENPNIFYQEGWHIEQDEEGKLSYKGVVFNEMKGAMGDPDESIGEKMLSLMFPESCYGYNSGGDPTVIPTLTYEQFLATYHRFYHPSNARIFLDGNIPLERTLKLIDEYLSRFDKLDDLPVMKLQTPVSADATMEFEIAEEEDPSGKERLELGKIIGGWQDRVKIMAARALNDYLAGNNEAPLKRALLSAGLVEQFYMYVGTIAQPYLMVEAKNIKDGAADEVLACIRETTEKLLSDGLDKEALSATINRMEFRAREPEEPQGLDRCGSAMCSWLYGGDPMQYLVFDKDFAALRAMLENGEMEALLRELLLDDTGLVTLRAIPCKGYGDKLREEENARLAAIAAGWSEADRAANKAMNEALQRWQQTPDTPEQLATLPVLDLSQISPDVIFTETLVGECRGVKILRHPVNTSGVVHLSLYFDLTDFSLDDLTAFSQLGALLGKLPTANYDVPSLQQALKNKVGRLDYSVSVVANKDETAVCTPQFVVHCSVLAENLSDAEALIEEILLRTDFSKVESIREILRQVDDSCKQVGVNSGHMIGMLNTMSHYSAAGAVNDALSGYPAVRWIHGLMKSFDEKIGGCIELWKKLASEVCCKSRLTLSVTGGEEYDPAMLLDRFAEGKKVPATAAYSGNMPMRCGFRIPAQVSFAVQGSQGDAALRDGAASVASNILSLAYLWNVVRVQGGAYGTGLRINMRGRCFTYSYRDPTPARSLQVNEGLSEQLSAFAASEEPIDKFIISTVAGTEPLRTPQEEGLAADGEYFAGITKADLLKYRAEILRTTKETLLGCCEPLDRFVREGAVSVVGYADVLKNIPDLELFDL